MTSRVCAKAYPRRSNKHNSCNQTDASGAATLLRLCRLMVVVSGGAFWTAIGGSWSVAQGGGEPKLHIEVQNGILLSVDLRDVAMGDVLRVVGEHAGVKVSICGKLENVKAEVFQNIPLDEGIRKLAEAGDVDIIMIYGPKRRLTEVRAYKWPLGPPPAPPPLRIPIPGAQSVPAQHK